MQDSSGAELAYQFNADYGELQGFAQVVLSIQGAPGETYTATGIHGATATRYQDPDEPESLPDMGGGFTNYGWIDYYNFGFFSTNPLQTFPNIGTWTSYGPAHYNITPDILVGQTTDSQSRFLDIPPIIFHAQQDLSSTCDQKFAAVIPGYTNAAFFSSLVGTEFHQWPKGTPNAPPSQGDASTRIDDPGRPIDIWPNFYGVNRQLPFPHFQEFVLVHEGIHHFTGWSDFYDSNRPNTANFVDKFGSVGYSPGSTSGCFTDWIDAGCPQTMPPCRL